MLVAILISALIALPLSLAWTWLIVRDHERLQQMHPRHPTDHQPPRNP